MQVFRNEPSTSAGTPSSLPPIGDALRATGVLNLSGVNAIYASNQWLRAPVSLIASLTPTEVIICVAKGHKTVGDIMGLKVAWTAYFDDTLGLKLLCAQNTLRPVLMTYGVPK